MHGLTGGSWKRSGHSATATEKNNPTGNRAVHSGSATYHRITPPRQLSTLHRGVVSSKTFKSLDNYLWTLTYKWATHSHANKPRTWVVTRYYGKYNKFRNDHWVFGDVASGAYLVKFSWTDIVRHTLVKGGASPDDPALTEYWAKRRRRATTLPRPL
jgi:RNA-directed DNA polymerase